MSTAEAAGESAAVEVRDLQVVRGGRPVIARLSCWFRAGAISGLLGPSGSGKSTLIRSIVGVQRTAGGMVTVLGRPAGDRVLRRRVAYMTQGASVYRDLTVAQNLRFFAALVGADDARCREVLDQVGLGKRRGALAGDLSGGQLSRVSLACALVGDPEVLVLDEPTVGQDPVLREELWDDFRDRARAGAAVLVSSHVMDEARRCDELLLLRDGQALTQGAPAQLMASTGATDMDAAFLELVHRAGA